MMDSITDQLKNLIIILADSQYNPIQRDWYTIPVQSLDTLEFILFKFFNSAYSKHDTNEKECVWILVECEFSMKYSTL